MDNKMPYVVMFACDNDEIRYLAIGSSAETLTTEPRQTSDFRSAAFWPDLDFARHYVDEKVIGNPTMPAIPQAADLVYMQVELRPIPCQHRYHAVTLDGELFDLCVYCGIDRNFVENGIRPPEVVQK